MTLTVEERTFERMTAGSLYLVIDYIITTVMGAIFWLLVAKLLQPTVVGQATIAISLVTALMGFLMLGVPTASAKYISEYNAKGKFGVSRAIFKLSLKLTFITGLIVAIALSISSGFISTRIYHSPELTVLIFGAALSLPFQTMHRTLHMGGYRGYQRMEFCAIGDITHSTAKLIIAVALIFIGIGALSVVLGFASGYIASALLGIFFLSKKVIRKPQTGDDDPPHGLLRQILSFGLPNYMANVLGILAKQMALLFLGFFSVVSAAFYNIAFLIISVTMSVSVSVRMALLPTVSEEWVKGKKHNVYALYNMVIRLSLTLTGPAIIAVLLFPKLILSSVSIEYMAASDVLQVLALSVIFNSVANPSLAVLNGIGRPREAMIVGVCSAATGIVLCILLIPIKGMVGAAIASTIASLLSASLGVIFLIYREKIAPKAGTIIKPMVCLALSATLGYFTLLQLGNVLLSGLSVIVTYIFAAWILNAVTKEEARFLLAAAKGLLTR